MINTRNLQKSQIFKRYHAASLSSDSIQGMRKPPTHHLYQRCKASLNTCAINKRRRDDDYLQACLLGNFKQATSSLNLDNPYASICDEGTSAPKEQSSGDASPLTVIELTNTKTIYTKNCYLLGKIQRATNVCLTEDLQLAAHRVSHHIAQQPSPLY